AQTPEWKKAYINYRALKKRITAVRRAEEGQISPEQSILSSQADLAGARSDSPSALANDESRLSMGLSPELLQDAAEESSPEGTRVDEGRKSFHSGDGEPSLPSSRSYRVIHSASSRPRDFSRRMSMTSRKSRPSTQRRNTIIHGHHHRTPQPFTAPATYSELLPLLSPIELNFFKLLDAELEKVESFYLDREKEMQERTVLLREQLNELNDHRKLFYPKAKLPAVDGAPIEKTLTKTTTKSGGGFFDSNRDRYHQGETPDSEEDIEDRLPPSPPATPVERSSTPQPRRRVMLDPDEYQHAKKRLKKAVLEHYRALQMLHNYRILNVTGFRKALKKFEKVTRIPCIDLYMREKVETSAFASDVRVRQMMTEMEDLYATRFVHGDKKRAMARLRVGTSQNSHHFSTFRSGMAIGLALPALVAGIYDSAFPKGSPRVQIFADFWMGDQFCSLVFTLSNLYFIPCTYTVGFDDWRQCTTSTKNWPVMFVVGTLPLTIRVVQSIKRYYDSRLVTHLVNGGKYGTGIVMYLFYFLWRHRTSYDGPFYALYIVTAILYSTYACTWDFLMDWSMLKTRAKYFLLRDEVLYTNHIPLYYFAIAYNALIRFAWVIYIPEKGPSFLLRTFIVGMLEMTRRWVWNFYRLENEHLGNMDQYRVTREVPLPYSLDELDIDMDEDAEAEAKKDAEDMDANSSS
ncbi:EXS family-domain-containing protein, partial [Schizophyllum commune]